MTGERLVQILRVLLASFATAIVAAAQPQTEKASYDIAFVAALEGRSGVYVMRGDGSRPTLLLGGESIILGPWSPDGKKIAYSCGGQAEPVEVMKKYRLPWHFTLCVVNVDGTGRQRLLNVPVTPFFKWSPDSRQVVFPSGYEDPDLDIRRTQPNREVAFSTAIYVGDVKTQKTFRLTPLGDNGFPSWSLDGRRIVFSGDVDAQNQDIYVVDADGQNLQRITTSPTIDTQPAWSPRGDLIAFIAAPRPGQAEGGVFVVRPDGSAARSIWTEGAASSVSWSPDGRYLLVHSSPIVLLEMTTGAVTKLGHGWLDATFAPDGRSVLYRTFDQDDSSIYACDLRSGSRKKLMPGSLFTLSPLLRRR
jgi:Tol biopolymer transport system component